METQLLVKVRGNGANFRRLAAKAFGKDGVDVEPILRVPRGTSSGQMGLDSTAADATWLRVGIKNPEENPWDAAHATMPAGRGLDADSAGVEIIEPDFVQSWLPESAQAEPPAPAAAGERCAFHNQDGGGGKSTGPGVAWNRGEQFSELKKALQSLGGSADEKLRQVIIAHLDTGYDPKHLTRPAGLDTKGQRNFVDRDRPNDATDLTPKGLQAIRNRGHGTATLALLAGNKLSKDVPNWTGFRHYLGVAPLARVIPIRIADWVVRFTVGAMTQGFDHARQHGAHVLSMSMGGLTSSALVDAINLSYDAGVTMVTAAGNNLAWMPTPKSTVFPARYQRVLSACGVMADGRSYSGLHVKTMQGNFGPASKMATSLGAYTPNVPWAVLDCANIVDMDGAGTSAATPQIAGAVALWLAEHFDEVMRYREPWMRVEAVRHALFASAAKSTAAMGAPETLEKIGQGVLKANAALAICPPAESELTKQPPSKASWGWLNLIFGGGVSLASDNSRQRSEMFALELTQMAQQIAAVEEAIGDNDLPPEQISGVARRRYFEAALDAGQPSKPLRAALENLLRRPRQTAGPTAPASPQRPVKRKSKVLPDPRRRLRVYALDPSIAKSLDSVAINETVLSIPWENDLQVGPVGEYLEVVDVDPASNRLYDPVDLNQPKLLAQDGWPPSEGNPQFHQQMVYAVAMTTIGHFEEALGRKALWAPRWASKPNPKGEEKPTAYEVPKLRIYPHALRTNNAYYSPDKMALLLGYFRASSQAGDATAPGSMVFSCLSSDIIAHEMSHALLDGLHRRFQEASNRDVPAFHEGFADIVALLQHFAIPELVRFQIGQARGKLSAARLLGGLAKQFGEGTQRGGALRDYLGDEIHKLDYATTTEVHDRGSILVSAVFDTLLKIIDYRTADLVRLATSGTGVLPEGALHPDLVNRLTDEACKAARHVLRMCIRALDYCPAVDITFGEYLRALITADIDLVPDDRYHYRVAFMESFRQRGLLPHDVRTVSEESLAWGTLENPQPAWLDSVVNKLNFAWDRALDRSDIFALNESNRWAMKNALKTAFAMDPELYADFGLLPGVPRYDEKGKVQREATDGGTCFDVTGVRPARRVAPDGTFRTEVIATIQQRQVKPVDPDDPSAGWFWFRGGASLIFDPHEGRRQVRYCIVKNIWSASRLARQRQAVADGLLSPLRALYFGESSSEPFAMLHADKGGFSHA